jgi:hypothetical protein
MVGALKGGTAPEVVNQLAAVLDLDFQMPEVAPPPLPPAPEQPPAREPAPPPRPVLVPPPPGGAQP